MGEQLYVDSGNGFEEKDLFVSSSREDYIKHKENRHWLEQEFTQTEIDWMFTKPYPTRRGLHNLWQEKLIYGENLTANLNKKVI